MKKQILTTLLLLFTFSLSFSQVNFTGSVVDESGQVLIGATVRVEGTSGGAITDINGEYSIENVNVGDVLIASYISMNEQRHTVAAGETNYNFVLTTSETALEDIVIIGYGEVEKDDVTGSITTVTSEDFNRGSISSPQQLLQGKTAGVTVTPGGAPGEGGVIRIRGGASLNASNDPLIVIDDVPIDTGGPAGSRNILASLNPQDIESFTVLKDASATAIYGSRASNGVIVITTKKGKSGDLKIGYRGLASLNTLDNFVDVWSGDEVRAYVNANGTEEQIGFLGDENTNWQEAIYSDTFGTQHSLDFTGGIANLPYRLSLGYDNQKGNLNTSEFERLSASLNLNPTFLENDALRINLNTKFARENNRFADRGAIGAAVGMDPTQPIYADYPTFGGFFEWTNTNLANGEPIPYNLGTRNPVSLLEQNFDESGVNRIISNLKADYDLPWVPGLTATVNLGIDYSDSDGGQFRPITAAASFNGVDGENLGSYERQYANQKTNSLLDAYLKYSKNIEPINTVFDIQGGYSWQEFDYELNETSSNLQQEFDPVVDINTHRLISYFGRTNIDIADKYILTGTIRRDGTSRFAEDNRWGNFPAVSLAWKLHNEPFIETIDAISTLKLRAGWGVTGQQNIGGLFDYLPTYTITSPRANYVIDGVPITPYRASGYNSTLKWEETETKNIGIDAAFLNNRFTASFDVYEKESSDLLSFVPVPAGTNLTNALNVNIGDLSSKGWELNLGGYPVDKESLSWESNFNISYNDIEIDRLRASNDPTFAGVELGGVAGATGTNVQIHTVGYHPASFFVLRQVYGQDGQPLEDVYVDRNNDGIINSDDKYRYENPDPDFTLGFTNALYAGNFDVSFTLRGSIGNYVYNNVASDRGIYNGIYNRLSLNNITDYVYDTDFLERRLESDFYIENADFVKMDNISLGYTFENNTIPVINGLKLFGTVNNVFTITDYSGIDPEIFGGIDNSIYPRSRTFSIGVTANY